MKTITECQPLIYGLLMEHAEHRRGRKRKNAQRLKTAMPVLYVAIGLAIVFDAGIMPWDFRFWLIFSPFFLFGERVLSAVAQKESRNGTAEFGGAASLLNAMTVAGNARTSEVKKRRKTARRGDFHRGSSTLLLSAFQTRRSALCQIGTQAPDLAMRSILGRSPVYAAVGRATAA